MALDGWMDGGESCMLWSFGLGRVEGRKNGRMEGGEERRVALYLKLTNVDTVW